MITDYSKALHELKRQVDGELAQFEEKKRLAEAIELVTMELKKRGLSSLVDARDPLFSNGKEPDRVTFKVEGGYGENTKRVRHAIKSINGAFNVGKIFKFLEGDDLPLTKSEIATVLTKLKKRGDISVLKPGTGRSATLYIPGKLAQPEGAQ
jgi:hypothetical protein